MFLVTTTEIKPESLDIHQDLLFQSQSASYVSEGFTILATLNIFHIKKNPSLSFFWQAKCRFFIKPFCQELGVNGISGGEGRGGVIWKQSCKFNHTNLVLLLYCHISGAVLKSSCAPVGITSNPHPVQKNSPKVSFFGRGGIYGPASRFVRDVRRFLPVAFGLGSNI